MSCWRVGQDKGCLEVDSLHIADMVISPREESFHTYQPLPACSGVRSYIADSQGTVKTEAAGFFETLVTLVTIFDFHPLGPVDSG